jgi:hypothetical protein
LGLNDKIKKNKTFTKWLKLKYQHRREPICNFQLRREKKKKSFTVDKTAPPPPTRATPMTR